MLLEKLNNFNIVLASSSPRRKQLLREMGLTFDVASKSVDEIYPKNLGPTEVAEFLSKLKADAFKANELTDRTLLISADTVVSCEGEVLGKPSDKDEAIAILRFLSGRTHEVITGVTIRTNKKQRTFSVTTRVTFSKLSAEEINYYIDNYEPYDKAGAYGIQEWIGHAAIESISGSYYNVMGLPTHRLYIELIGFINKLL